MGIHQFISYLHQPGDGAADHAYGFQRAFRSWGYNSHIYALQTEDNADGLSLDKYEPSADDLLVYHYVGGSELTDMFLSFPGKRVVYYQNVTPPELIRPFHAEMASRLAEGQEQIHQLRNLFTLVPSEYSRQELLSYGFSSVEVIPLLIDLDRLHKSASSKAGRQVLDSFDEDSCIWLAVGRIAPNKRCEDIIKAFAYYHHWINPNSQLVFVGGDKHFEAYAFNLYRLVDKLDVSNYISWKGWVDYDDGFGAYYQAASLFIHMSEHEGFGIPLIEAMEFEVPVIAYKTTAVPYTLGKSGILVNETRYEAIAEAAHLLFTDLNLRKVVINNQTKRLQIYNHPKILRRLMTVLTPYLPSKL